MSHLEISVKGNPVFVLPTLLVAKHIERSNLLSPIKVVYGEEKAPAGEEGIHLTLTDGKTISDKEVLPYLTNIALENADPDQKSSVKEWIKRSDGFNTLEFKALGKAFDELHAHLTLRSYIVGYSITVADLVIWGKLRGNRVAQTIFKTGPSNVSRWYSYIEQSNPWIPVQVSEFTAQALKEKVAASSVGASYSIDLPNIDGPLVTRFPPEPSGYLHIGHAKAALLNDYFARQRKGGKLICRFDDTNPTKETAEFQDAILHDLKLMEITPDIVTHSSDSFQQMYEYALKMIKDGKAFADDSELGKGDEDRRNRLPSKRRDLGIEETLTHFEEMKTGSTEGQRWCLRARIAYDSPNGTLRDPVIYRCNPVPHHRTGDTWKIYPTYDFCAPVLDSIEGVTVALRTNEYRDRNPQYEWMQDALGLRKVAIWDFSRMNFIRTVLSKRKLTKIVDEGKVWGWDDPRMPTIRGILRRGMTVPALREFILKQGPSKNILNLEWGAFWALNKKYIDPEAPRHIAIAQNKAVHCTIQGVEGESEADKPKHGKNAKLGTKKVIYGPSIILEQADAQSFAENEEITLMNWGNAFVRSITRESAAGGDKNTVTGIKLELHLEGDVKKTDKKVTWLAESSKTNNKVDIDLVSFDYLITKDKLEKDDQLESFLTPTTEFRTAAFADCNVAALAPGTIIQFERKGYYKLDGPSKDDKSRLVFFNIPSGKS